MEPEVSLPHSQVPAKCPYPEQTRSSPFPHIPLPEDPSQYYLSIYAWVSQVVSFLQVSPPKPCIRLSSPPYALHAPPISFFSVLSSEQYVQTRRVRGIIITLFFAVSILITLNDFLVGVGEEKESVLCYRT